MKKILFIMPSMEVEGTVKSLIELLNIIPRDVFEVHLGLFNVMGKFLEQVPQGIHIHRLHKPRNNKETFFSLIRSFHWIDALVFIHLWLYSKYTNDSFRLYQYRYRDISDNIGCFDLAIAYSILCVYYLCEKVDANAKCCWIHQDVTVPLNRIQYKILEKLYPRIDKIFVVSEEAKRRFDSVYPQIKHKTDLFHNIIPVNHILELAKTGDSFTDNYKGKRLLTVGRINQQKGLLLAIKVLKILIYKGYDVNWYIIGGGIGNHYYKQCIELAIQEKVFDHFIFLDVRMNPYRFMHDCDVYVQPSLYESYCITLAEALCFGNPIVCTDFCGAEQMKGRANGYIREMTPTSLADGIIKALNDRRIEVFPIHKKYDINKLLQFSSNKE